MKSVYHIAQISSVWPNGGWEQGFNQNGYKYRFTDWQAWQRDWGITPTKIKILREVEAMRPDFVFMQIQRPDLFDADFIAELQATCPVVHFNEDVREDVQWMVSLGCFLTLMTNTEDVRTLQEQGCNAEFMMPTYDERYYKQEGQSCDCGEIVFIGNKYSDSNLNFPNARQRDEMVALMTATFPDKFRAYGRGYGPFLDPKLEAQAYRGCTMAVMHNNFTRQDYSSDRILRAMACGAVVLPHRTQATTIDTMFIESTGWDTLEELSYICNELLKNRTLYKSIRSVQQQELLYHSPANKIKNLEFILNDYI